MTPGASTQEPGAFMRAEIAEQPDVLSHQMTSGLGALRRAASRIREASPRFVLLAARGTSDHAALYGKYLVETTLGLPCGLASLSTLTGYEAQPHYDDVLWLAVSQSGGSPDLVESTQRAASAGALTVALTNNPDSDLAAAAKIHLDLHAGPEQSVAATKTYTAQLQALWLLVDAWRGGDGAAAAHLPQTMRAAMDNPTVEEMASRLSRVERLVTVGRGFSYPTAREAALKLMETSYLAAHAFSGADLLHGPLAMIEENTTALVVAPRGTSGRLLVPALHRLRQQRASISLIGDQALAADIPTTDSIPLPAVDDETLSPLVEIVPCQQLALRISLARGLDPDRPRALSKVTETL